MSTFGFYQKLNEHKKLPIGPLLHMSRLSRPFRYLKLKDAKGLRTIDQRD